jgi:predicted dehydrogenase
MAARRRDAERAVALAEDRTVKVAVFGYGLIGRERVNALCELRSTGEEITQLIVCDPFATKEREAVEKLGATWCDSVEAVLALDPQLIVVATPHDAAVRLVEQLLPSGARVLMEKPFGRSLAEAEQLAAQMRDDSQIFVGFNYRFFPGVAGLIADARAGRFGALIAVNMVLGHGGSPGMNTGWKFDPVKAGGGCLIDPGIHLLDLCHQLSPGGIKVRGGRQWRGFWNTGIEEDVHLLLDAESFAINLQVSVVRWRSVFQIEAHGVDGYGIVTGRGRSYGPQRYRRGQRWGWQSGVPQEQSEEEVSVSDCQESFCDELRALLRGGSESPHPCTAREALQVMRTYQACLENL